MLSGEAKGSEYRSYIAEAIKADSAKIADLWLERLVDVVDESTRDIFPTEQYLDHIPSMIDEIGNILAFPEADMSLANSLIERKADQLGTLRHQQRATINQLLREYDLLSSVLEQFIIDTTNGFGKDIKPEDSIELMASVARIVRSILQSTVDSFVVGYMSTIQEQTEKILSFNEFVSHELKTPLQAAQLNVELLMETKDLGATDVRDLLLIQTSIQQASSLLQNIENLISNSDTPVTDSPIQQEVNLSAFIRDIGKQLEESLVARGVDLIIDDELGSVVAETAKLKLIFTNILTNAIKYSDPEKDSKTVRVQVNAESEAQETVITVRDNGLGIDEHAQAEVFKLRFRAHEEMDEQLEITGYGMGLYLVAEALRDIGGSIDIQSSVGEGTTVSIILPKEPPATRLGK